MLARGIPIDGAGADVENEGENVGKRRSLLNKSLYTSNTNPSPRTTRNKSNTSPRTTTRTSISNGIPSPPQRISLRSGSTVDGTTGSPSNRNSIRERSPPTSRHQSFLPTEDLQQEGFYGLFCNSSVELEGLDC